MGDTVEEKERTPEEKEWTLMFYFASDNPLAPSIVSQLKALKNAGFHAEANVIAHFDPHTGGTPLHIFDINCVLKAEAIATVEGFEKIKKSAGVEARGKLDNAREPALESHRVGFSPNDPYIRNLVFDRLWGEATILYDGKDTEIEGCIRKQIKRNIERSLVKEQEQRGLKKDEIVSLTSDEIDELGKYYNPPNPFPERPEKSPEKSEPGDGEAKPAGGKDENTSDKDEPAHDLNDFLQFCAKEYPARHYMLFILGHGLVVGNAMFLLDEHAAKSSLSLGELGKALADFNKNKKVGDLELVAFHSCSMSSIEVAYELQDNAKYMIASQGPEFVGSWPYTQILVRVFNDILDNKSDIESTVEKIHSYCFYNSYDFQMAGYSFDLTLCDLRKIREELSSLISKLSTVLQAALDDEVAKGAILLAHWDAQSFWRDTYTDLYDFCLCLHRRCAAAAAHLREEMTETKSKLESIRQACFDLMKKLRVKDKDKAKDKDKDTDTDERAEDGERGGEVILKTGFAGPSHQYSHGLSVFFPWSEPSNKAFWKDEYKEGYEFKETGWHAFLQRYFDETMRVPRRTERGHTSPEALIDSTVREYHRSSFAENLLETITAKLFASEQNQLGKGGGGDAVGKGGGGDAVGKGGGGDAIGKGGGGDASGDDCDCPPIKNYPSYTRKPQGKKRGGDEKNLGDDGGEEALTFSQFPSRDF